MNARYVKFCEDSQRDMCNQLLENQYFYQYFQKQIWMQGTYRLTSFAKGSQRDGNNWLECWALAPNMFFDVKVKTSRENHNQNINVMIKYHMIQTQS